MMSKPIIAYHSPCYDGFGAAYAAWLFFGDNADYIPCSYGKPLPDFEPNRLIYMIDFSGTREEMERLYEHSGKQLIIIDHHKTAEENLKGLPYAHFDMSKSGALLAFEYFDPTVTPWVKQFFHHLSDRDLWEFKLEGTNEVHAALSCYPYDFKVWNLMANKLPELIQEGKALLKYRKQLVDNMCKSAYMTMLDGHDVVMCNATCMWSEVGNELCQLYPQAKFAAVFYFDETGKKWSLRSVGDFDVSEVAKAHGGGGHKNAAGFVEKL